ncbi:hypothetical protein EF405_13920 [Cyclobacteriaceae bacterium YHN15]|jgi:hypothetical protein|nr:hypothetical protein EF405_13920 [Cyclobacteriaceae bacterium YHN15]
MKRNIAIWFLFLAQTMMLGHNLIPHHHQDPFESLFIKSHPCSHHHHEYPYGMLESIFSLVPHSEKGMEAIHCTHIDQSVNKQSLSLSAGYIEDINFRNSYIFLVEVFSDQTEDLESSLKILPSGLRAPPIIA